MTNIWYFYIQKNVSESIIVNFQITLNKKDDMIKLIEKCKNSFTNLLANTE